MPNDDKSLEILNSQQVMNQAEWTEYIKPIQETVAKIREKYGHAPDEYVFERIGSDGNMYEYVREEFFVEILNDHFPDWSFVIPHPPHFIGQLVYVSGRLVLNFRGVRRVFDDTGEDKIKLQKKDGSMVSGAIKSATTDVFKRCCHRALGAALNVYNKKDLERQANVQMVRDIIAYIEDALNDSELISSASYTKLEGSLEYFQDLKLPKTDKGWNDLKKNLNKFKLFKEAVDAERTRKE